MKWIALLIVVFVAFSAISACGSSTYADTGVSMYRDPLGMTTREMVRQDGATKRTELEMSARMEESYNERKAIESQSFYQFAASAVWAGSMPFIVLMIGVSLILIFAVRGLLVIGNTQASSGAKMLPHYDDWKRSR